MADPPPPFALTAGERASPLWLRLRAHFQDRLDRVRLLNDQPLPESETARVRGQIATLKALIALDSDPPGL